ncbi:hypothetical protein HMPREF2990_10075 [Corynebacterium sp. HMSC071B10]|nr:hypothetical protein HMPREF2990_10075 [Corynebacterium sp. HMSC071B10]OHF39908.1 hypothetical protein HMPREF2550_01535 [Corynebacterium sp. HMSC074A01]
MTCLLFSSPDAFLVFVVNFFTRTNNCGTELPNSTTLQPQRLVLQQPFALCIDHIAAALRP